MAEAYWYEDVYAGYVIVYAMIVGVHSGSYFGAAMVMVNR